MHEVIHAGIRDVIDGTEAIMAVHINHDYTSADPDTRVVGADTLKGGETFWQKNKADNWQILHNIDIANSYGSYHNQDGTSVHCPWKLVSCLDTSTRICVVKRLRPAICSCEHHSYAMHTQTDPKPVEVIEKGAQHTSKIIKCGSVSTEKPGQYDIPVHVNKELQPKPIFGLPFTMNDLLQKVVKNKHVIVTGVSENYKDITMNFVCNLRRLNIYDNLIIAAFDEEMYKFGFRMGLPVFLYEPAVAGNFKAANTEYGSDAFKKVSGTSIQL